MEELNPSIITKVLPMMFLRGKVLLPNNIATIDVARVKSLAVIDNAVQNGRYVFFACQKDRRVELPTLDDVYNVGVVGFIKEIMPINATSKRVVVQVFSRAKIVALRDGDVPFAEIIETPFVGEEDIECEVLRKFCIDEYKKLLSHQKKRPELDFLSNDNVRGHEFVNVATFGLPLEENKKQEILETDQMVARLELLYKALLNLNDFINVEKKIAQRVKDSMDKSQKEYYLREQLKAIHAELGDDEQEKEKLEKQIKDKKMPKDIEEKVLKELFKMSRMNPSSPDYTVIRGYLDWILDLPFNSFKQETVELKDAKAVLEADHYGLEKVKERILEYLAVYKLTGKLNGPILCLVGPPGVGKTSIAGSIARALGREFVRMSVGGVKDEAEVRGHRKTYIGAMPGRIIFGMKEAKCNNPVFLLDEIDKISSDLRGDPASALLEVLDPQQNNTFRDRYLEIPYDLSQVMFVTTANTLDTIPAPLLDRMEVITLSGYTYKEKEEIAKRYLIPREIEKNGLNNKLIKFTEDGIKAIIEGYTKEAGVRNLEREIGSVCRKVATDYSLNKSKKLRTISAKTVANYLGASKYEGSEMLEDSIVGVSTGLAWTQVGGTTLSIEVNLFSGKGNLTLTGKLGDVMQESAKTALSHVKTYAESYGIDKTLFDTKDFHIHVPEGATPKDGPSAGITIATAIVSALTNKAVSNQVAMTGEITLRGRVLAIGGLKEKALAAYSIGIRKVIIPHANLKDLEEIPEAIRSQITFIPVKELKEVLKEALV